MRLHDFFSRADFNRCYLPSCIKSDPTNHWWMAPASHDFWFVACLSYPGASNDAFYDLDFETTKFTLVIAFWSICSYTALNVFALEAWQFVFMSKNLTQSLKHGHVFIKITTLVNQKVVFIIGISNMHFRRHLSHIFHWTQFILFTSIWCSSILLLYSAVILSEPQSIYLKLGHFVLKIGWVE